MQIWSDPDQYFAPSGICFDPNQHFTICANLSNKNILKFAKMFLTMFSKNKLYFNRNKIVCKDDSFPSSDLDFVSAKDQCFGSVFISGTKSKYGSLCQINYLPNKKKRICFTLIFFKTKLFVSTVFLSKRN